MPEAVYAPAPFSRDSVRIVSWVVLLALAALQGWAGRFAISSDGVAYLDLSDGVVGGRWSDLLNAYWSPGYPVAIGVLRLIFRPAEYWELAIPHLANFLFFVAALAAFEYFLTALATRARDWGRAELSTATGRVAAYVVFGALTLVMTPLTLTTPDMAVSATVYAALGAMLILSRSDAPVRAAYVLSAALAAGSLTKTFMIPWSVVCLGTAIYCVPRGGRRRMAPRLILPWGLVVAAWTVALSSHVGRATFGDTGRLTYAWFVNMKVPPSSGQMPPATRSAAVDSLLPGIGVTPAAAGTNPLWYDPPRWYAGVGPEADLPQQLRVSVHLTALLAAALAPILFLVAVVAGAAPRRLLEGVSRAWPVVAPALAGIAGYTMILVATRYLAAFVIASSLTLWVAFDWPRRISVAGVAAALAIVSAVMWRASEAPWAFAAQAAIIAAVVIAFAARRLPIAAQMAAATAGGLAVRLLLPPSLDGMPQLGLGLALLAFMATGVLAERRGDQEAFSWVTRRWWTAATAAVLLIASARKYADSLAPLRVGGAQPANAAWATAQRLRAAGLEPGTPIALVGTPFEAYWARSLRAQIVAVIPAQIAGDFWELPDARREAVIRKLADHGAAALVVTVVPTSLARDPRWRSEYPSGVRVLGR